MIHVMANDRELLLHVIRQCREYGLDPIVSGGWAEELSGVKPWRHSDIDLMICGENLSQVDNLISNSPGWREIEDKRFPHKRAAIVDEIMVEFILIQRNQSGFFTHFFDLYLFILPSECLYQNIKLQEVELKIADSEVLRSYRINHNKVDLAYQRYISQPRRAGNRQYNNR